MKYFAERKAGRRWMSNVMGVCSVIESISILPKFYLILWTCSWNVFLYQLVLVTISAGGIFTFIWIKHILTCSWATPGEMSVSLTEAVGESVDRGPVSGVVWCDPWCCLRGQMTSQLILPRSCNCSSEMTGHRLALVDTHNSCDLPWSGHCYLHTPWLTSSGLASAHTL